MKVTGYKFKQAIKELKDRVEVTRNNMSNSVKYFPSQDKPDVYKMFNDYKEAEIRLAMIQTYNQQYNLEVKVDVAGKKISLAQAVKMLGGASRCEKFWREAAKSDSMSSPGGRRFSRYHQLEARDKEKEYPVRVVEESICLDEAAKESRYVSRLKEAIQTGQATQVNYPELHEDMFKA